MPRQTLAVCDDVACGCADAVCGTRLAAARALVLSDRARLAGAWHAPTCSIARVADTVGCGCAAGGRGGVRRADTCSGLSSRAEGAGWARRAPATGVPRVPWRAGAKAGFWIRCRSLDVKESAHNLFPSGMLKPGKGAGAREGGPRGMGEEVGRPGEGARHATQPAPGTAAGGRVDNGATRDAGRQQRHEAGRGPALFTGQIHNKTLS